MRSARQVVGVVTQTPLNTVPHSNHHHHPLMDGTMLQTLIPLAMIMGIGLTHFRAVLVLVCLYKAILRVHLSHRPPGPPQFHSMTSNVTRSVPLDPQHPSSDALQQPSDTVKKSQNARRSRYSPTIGKTINHESKSSISKMINR
jgi:hypothetical protein